MQAETNFFRDVFYQQNLAMMGNKALQFASETNLVEMRDTLRAATAVHRAVHADDESGLAV